MINIQQLMLNFMEKSMLEILKKIKHNNTMLFLIQDLPQLFYLIKDAKMKIVRKKKDMLDQRIMNWLRNQIKKFMVLEVYILKLEKKILL